SSTWSLNHTLDWSIPRISNDSDDVAESTRSGTPAFSFNRNDLGTFFLVRVSFVAQGSITGIDVAHVERVGEG
ncbi:hypothetical protein F5141DRAFT_993238, partial [Pisolithus sp. B1]